MTCFKFPLRYLCVSNVLLFYFSAVLEITMNFGQSYQQQYQPITATFSGASNDPHYKGYEQAVIEHAKLMQVQQAKQQLFGVPAPRKPFVGQWQKKRKLPKDPVDPRKYFCDTCNVTCGGPDSFEAHLAGKSHKHKEGLKTGKIRLDLSRPGYHCEVILLKFRVILSIFRCATQLVRPKMRLLLI